MKQEMEVEDQAQDIYAAMVAEHKARAASMLIKDRHERALAQDRWRPNRSALWFMPGRGFCCWDDCPTDPRVLHLLLDAGLIECLGMDTHQGEPMLRYQPKETATSWRRTMHTAPQEGARYMLKSY